MFLKINAAIEKFPLFYRNKVHFVDTLSRRTYFWDTAVQCGSENSHNVVQLNPDEDKYYLPTPYPTLMQSLKKFSPESIRAIARNPNIDTPNLLHPIIFKPNPQFFQNPLFNQSHQIIHSHPFQLLLMLRK